ncbi:MAG TPA: TadE family protein [Candidatus Dormibacteraeota bacterium]|nr:TadE family protein [Candidatus Dormibacteraeota bacterium]
MVEFAIVAPLGFLLLLGIVVAGLVEMDQIGLTNATRDAARAAAICGSSSRDSSTKLPDGSTVCSYSALKSYVSTRVSSLPSGSASKPSTSGYGSNCDTTPTNAVICVWTSTHGTVSISGSNPLDACAKGDEIEIVTQFNAQLYLPLVSNFLGTGGGSSRALTADATATCEQ